MDVCELTPLVDVFGNIQNKTKQNKTTPTTPTVKQGAGERVVRQDPDTSDEKDQELLC